MSSVSVFQISCLKLYYCIIFFIQSIWLFIPVTKYTLYRLCLQSMVNVTSDNCYFKIYYFKILVINLYWKYVFSTSLCQVLVYFLNNEITCKFIYSLAMISGSSWYFQNLGILCKLNCNYLCTKNTIISKFTKIASYFK